MKTKVYKLQPEMIVRNPMGRGVLVVQHAQQTFKGAWKVHFYGISNSEIYSSDQEFEILKDMPSQEYIFKQASEERILLSLDIDSAIALLDQIQQDLKTQIILPGSHAHKLQGLLLAIVTNYAIIQTLELRS